MQRSNWVWNRTLKWGMWLGVGLMLVTLGCGMPSASSDTPSASGEPAETRTITEQGQVLPITAEAIIAGEVIQLEVTRTREEQALGLMFRPALEDNRGMLFSFPRAMTLQFWMKNVLIPLDMIFLRDGEVQAIITAPPCDRDPCPTYGPNTPVDTVIEIRGGRAAELGLAVGDRVEIQFF